MQDELKLLSGFQKHRGKQISAFEWNTDMWLTFNKEEFYRLYICDNFSFELFRKMIRPVLESENNRKNILNYTWNSKRSSPMNYVNHVCLFFYKCKGSSLVSFLLCNSEASSVGYRFRQLPNQQKRVWVMGQSWAMNSYSLCDVMPSVTARDKGNAGLFQSTTTAITFDIQWQW